MCALLSVWSPPACCSKYNGVCTGYASTFFFRNSQKRCFFPGCWGSYSNNRNPVWVLAVVLQFHATAVTWPVFLSNIYISYTFFNLSFFHCEMCRNSFWTFILLSFLSPPFPPLSVSVHHCCYWPPCWQRLS